MICHIRLDGLDKEDIYNQMLLDKKKNNVINFVLLSSIESSKDK